jgi:biotin carboxyl carrier protein
LSVLHCLEEMMAYIASSRGQTHRVEVRQERDRLGVCLDGRDFPADVLRIAPHHYSMLLDGRHYEIDVLEMEEASVVLVNGQPFRVDIRRERERRGRPQRGKGEEQANQQWVIAPMPGKVVKLLVQSGDAVQEGDGVVVVEAMKMENELKAPAAGTIAEIRTQEGKAVNGGDVLVVIR